jgi:hypothetical protein
VAPCWPSIFYFLLLAQGVLLVSSRTSIGLPGVVGDGSETLVGGYEVGGAGRTAGMMVRLSTMA